MGVKNENEITMKIKGSLSDFYKYLKENKFKITEKFSMEDTFFIPVDLDTTKTSTREFLSKAILIRHINNETYKKDIKFITYKMKEINKQGEILSQSSINCNIVDIEEAKKLLIAIGYNPIMKIIENDIVYEREGFKICVKDIQDGEKLIECETNNNFHSIDELIKKIDEYNIPVYKDDYFVKKAEIELEKVIRKQLT